MVTQYNVKDVVSFGNFIAEQIKKGIKVPDSSGDIEVSHADFENWKVSKLTSRQVRAKFNCHFINQEDEEVHTINMMAVVEGSDENKQFSKYTPGGNISMLIDADCEARKLFIEGQDYYIDFVIAKK